MADVDALLLNSTYANTRKFTLNGLVVIAKCVKVYDGDTAHFAFRQSLESPIYRMSCRFLGYNSAEIKGCTEKERACAQASKLALQDKILDKIVTLKIKDFDKYGRPLITVICDNIDINQWMLTNNFGQPYVGSGQKRW